MTRTGIGVQPCRRPAGAPAAPAAAPGRAPPRAARAAPPPAPRTAAAVRSPSSTSPGPRRNGRGSASTATRGWRWWRGAAACYHPATPLARAQRKCGQHCVSSLQQQCPQHGLSKQATASRCPCDCAARHRSQPAGCRPND